MSAKQTNGEKLWAKARDNAHAKYGARLRDVVSFDVYRALVTEQAFLIVAQNAEWAKDRTLIVDLVGECWACYANMEDDR